MIIPKIIPYNTLHFLKTKIFLNRIHDLNEKNPKKLKILRHRSVY
jgi:hypothetical protein